MDTSLTELFLYELRHQCRFAIQAYNDLANALNAKDGGKIWPSLELFFISAAKISIIFWPQRDKYKQRGGSKETAINR